MKKGNKTKALRKFVKKQGRKQKGGFIGVLVAALMGLGMAAESAAVVAPAIVGGVVSGAASTAVSKIAGGSIRNRAITRTRTISTRPIFRPKRLLFKNNLKLRKYK